jgi:hypothetical protein
MPAEVKSRQLNVESKNGANCMVACSLLDGRSAAVDEFYDAVDDWTVWPCKQQTGD